MIRIAVIGFGYWGPNIVRNFSRLPNAEISWICDVNPKSTISVTHIYPAIRITRDVGDILTDQTTDAVIIATPTSTHFTLALQALKAGKHVLIEKPMTDTVPQARTLVALARKKHLSLMVDHTFLYTPAIQKIKQIIGSGQLGNIFYVDCVRTNLGLIQKDSNVVFDLATHDFSIIDFLFNAQPNSISASGIHHQNTSQEAVAYITATYKQQLYVHTHVSWLSPVKIRRMLFIGSKKMLVYDDMEPTEKIKIYDKSISVTSDPKAWQQLRIGYRIGSTVAPHVEVAEGLAGMAEAFVRCVKTGTAPPSDGAQGLRVVRLLTAATKSLRRNGKPVAI